MFQLNNNTVLLPLDSSLKNGGNTAALYTSANTDLMDVIPVWFGRFCRGFTRVVNNVGLETSKGEETTILISVSATFIQVGMTSCDAEMFLSSCGAYRSKFV